jgi:hypothetical protein
MSANVATETSPGVGYGQPTPGAGASTTSTCPLLALMTSSIPSVPRQSPVSKEQGATLGAAEHGREAGAADLDPLEHLTPFAATGGVVRCVRGRGPDAAVRVEADAVRRDPVGPDPTVGQGAVVGDVEGGEPRGRS